MKALNRFIGEARSVTDASAGFEQERSMALTDSLNVPPRRPPV
jgi:hypothetical protein